jgi:CCR4-NOT transcription complex subunit 1
MRLPGFAFAWLELISHRMFMPKLLLTKAQKGWPLFQRLLVELFKFLEPYLRNAELSDPIRMLYKGTLRVLLVLLHDFPEFLCDFHYSFCDIIPTSCIQMRNLILSAFPRNMRLPDPFTPNLKVDLLPEINQSPRILSNYAVSLGHDLLSQLDNYLKNRSPVTFLLGNVKNM